MAQQKTILDHALDHEAAHPDQIWLTQPVGGGRVVDLTWRQAFDEARRMAAHLQSLALPRGARIAMLSKNCAHFIVAELAIWMAGGTTVAIFPTETAETVRYVLEHSEASLLFVGKLDTWEQQRAGVPAALPCIALPLAPASARAAYETWEAVVEATAPLVGRPERGADEIAMIMYTSGSTGQPKGVMHSFGRVTAASDGIVQVIRELTGDEAAHRTLSYLPLAHSYERAWVECANLRDGRGRIFFAESLDTFVEDLKRARPTTFLSVPRLWLKFQQGVFAKMPPKKLDRLLAIPIVGRLVAKKVLAGLGLDQVRVAASGSAPIPAELILWYRKLGLNLLEGYAMTEDFAFSHGSTATKQAPGTVGVPYPGVQVRIEPDGEILVKSPGQLVGYYKRPDLDAECFTADGFFRTGDLGELDARGLLRITGRKKELFKTSKGKYVAPAPIENLLNAHPMVELSLVSGVSQPAAYGLVVLAEALRPRLDEPALRQEVEREMAALLASVNRQLAGHEQLRMIVVAREAWSIENGMLTPTMKIKRTRIEKAIEPQVGRWFTQPGPVFWAGA